MGESQTDKLIKELVEYKTLLEMYMEHDHDEEFMEWWLEKVEKTLKRHKWRFKDEKRRHK